MQLELRTAPGSMLRMPSYLSHAISRLLQADHEARARYDLPS
jgi:hypothetical protein